MDYVELRSFDNDSEANIVLNRLQQQRINCHLKEKIIRALNPLLSPALRAVKLMVHHSHVEKAWDMMNRAEEDYLKKIRCPVCKMHTLTIISITKKHTCKLAALANMLLTGRSVEVTKMYRCSHCGYDFKELP